MYGYQNQKTGKRVYTIWRDEAIPGDDCQLSERDFGFVNGGFEDPVLVDVITGSVYEIPEEKWIREGNIHWFKGIPVYDSPVLIADRSLIPLRR